MRVRRAQRIYVIDATYRYLILDDPSLDVNTVSQPRCTYRESPQLRPSAVADIVNEEDSSYLAMNGAPDGIEAPAAGEIRAHGRARARVVATTAIPIREEFRCRRLWFFYHDIRAFTTSVSLFSDYWGY